MNSPSATDTKDGSAYESLQSLEIRIIAMDWIVLLCAMVRETNLEVSWRVTVTALSHVRPCCLVDLPISLQEVPTCLTKLHGVTRKKTLTFTVIVLSFVTLRHR